MEGLVRAYGNKSTVGLLAFGSRARNTDDHVHFLALARQRHWLIENMHATPALCPHFFDGIDIFQLTYGGL